MLRAGGLSATLLDAVLSRVLRQPEEVRAVLELVALVPSRAERALIESVLAPTDVAMGISTSGESPNVVAALQAAKAQGLRTIAVTGRDGGSVGRAAEIHVNVPDQNTARVQEVHRTLLHVMCELIEEDANA